MDFLIRKGTKPAELVNVCWSLENDNTKKREIQGMMEALKEFKLPKGIILTYNYEDEIKQGTKTIKFMPVWKWMLNA